MLVAIGGCSKEVVWDKLVERGGLVYEVNSQTPFTGSSVSYYDNGRLKEKENYKDGKADGLYETYYENGQQRYKWNYKDGKSDGFQYTYKRNGELERKTRWVDGELELWVGEY